MAGFSGATPRNLADSLIFKGLQAEVDRIKNSNILVFLSLADMKAQMSQGNCVLINTDGAVNYSFESGDFTGKDDDVNVVALNSVPLSSGALLRQRAASIQTSDRRSLQRRLDDVASLADKLEVNDFDDIKAAATLSFARANPGIGRGITLRVPPKVLTFTEPLFVPSFVELVGSGRRDTFFIPNHDGPMFVFDGVVLSGIHNCRMGMGTGADVCAIDIKTTNTSTRALSFTNLEIVGGGAAGAKTSSKGGQTAIRAFTSGSNIITECHTDRIIISEVDRPIVMSGPEGNRWEGLVIDQFGYSGLCGLELITHADHFDARIAGAPTAGTIAYKQGGFKSTAKLFVDCGVNTKAIALIENHGCYVFIRRPYEAGPPTIQSPLGDYARGNIVDDDFRRYDLGPALSSANFAGTTGLGTGWSVSQITGDDKRGSAKFTAGTSNFGPVVLSAVFAAGPWAYPNAYVQIRRVGGSQPDVKPGVGSASTTGWGASLNLTATAGESYDVEWNVY